MGCIIIINFTVCIIFVVILRGYNAARMKWTLYIALGFIILSPNSLKAQVTASEPTQSVMVLKHSPRKASLYSAVLPGLGQAYNRKYWKIPIVYAGFATLGYFFYFNATNYNEYKQALIDFSDNYPETNSYLLLIGPNLNPETFDKWLESPLYDPSTAQWFRDQLENNMNYYKRYRDLTVILSAVWYALNIIDATVDAYLFDYEISDDLSMNIDPQLFSLPNNNRALGLSLSFSF